MCFRPSFQQSYRFENFVGFKKEEQNFELIGVCDFAEYVACFMESVSVIPEEPEPEPEPEPVPDVGCPPGLTGDYEWNESCHMFIKCFNGVQNGPFSCGTLQFNPFTRSCDHPSNRIPPCSG